jgi:tetratricopeptide (TPR) repeat protein
MDNNWITEAFNSAVQSEKNGSYDDALVSYKSIIKADPGCREAYINLGSLYSRMNNLPEAMNYYEKALSLGKDYLTFFNIGSIHYKMDDYKKAIMNLEKSKIQNARFLLSSLVLGLCYSRLDNLKAAEINFSDVLKINPQNRVALTALAILFYNQNKYSRAIQLLNTILKYDEANIKIKELRSNILLKTGKIDESKQDIKSIKSISDGYRYYDEFIKSIPVEAYNDKYGTINEKIDFLKGNIENDKKSLISLSLCHLFKGETDAAIDYLFQFKGTINS